MFSLICPGTYLAAQSSTSSARACFLNSRRIYARDPASLVTFAFILGEAFDG